MSSADSQSLIVTLEPPPELPRPEDYQPQFGLKSLFVFTTLLAVGLAVARLVGYFTAPLLFLAAVIHGIRRVLLDYSPARKLRSDLIWGVGMPLVCLAFDPVVFQGERMLLPKMQPHQLLWTFPTESISSDRLSIPPWRDFYIDTWNLSMYSILLLEIAGMAGWLFSSPRAKQRIGGFVSGFFTGGSVIALVIGLAIGPFSMMATIVMGAGLPGFTPLLTSWAYGSRAREAWRAASVVDQPNSHRGVLFLCGLLVVVAVPIAMFVLAHQ